MIKRLLGMLSGGDYHIGFVILEKLDAGGGRKAAVFFGSGNLTNQTDGKLRKMGFGLFQNCFGVLCQPLIQKPQFLVQNRGKMFCLEPVIPGLNRKGIIPDADPEAVFFPDGFGIFPAGFQGLQIRVLRAAVVCK